ADRRLHRIERFQLEAVDRVHRVIDVLEGALQRFDRDGRGGGLFVDGRGLRLQQLARRINDVRGGRVERGDLIEHQFLVGQRLRHRNRGAQGGNGGGGGAIDPLHQLDIVLLDQI